MAMLREALRTYLLADATLSAILTGGIWDAQTTDQYGADTDWIERDPVNGVTIAPFAILRFGAESSTEVVARSERRFMEIYFYQAYGFSLIEAAISRTKAILHRKRVQADDADAFFVFVTGSRDSSAPEYENAAVRMSRYYCDYIRRG
jgi:hypothetical protein